MTKRARQTTGWSAVFALVLVCSLVPVLWIVSLGLHLGYDYLVDGKGDLAGLGSASLTLYFAVTYAIQRVILQARAQRIAASPHQGINDPGTRTPSW